MQLYTSVYDLLYLQSIIVTFDGITGRMKMINNTISKLVLNVDQGFMWYNSSDGRNINSSQASGAYIFR